MRLRNGTLASTRAAKRMKSFQVSNLHFFYLCIFVLSLQSFSPFALLVLWPFVIFFLLLFLVAVAVADLVLQAQRHVKKKSTTMPHPLFLGQLSLLWKRKESCSFQIEDKFHPSNLGVGCHGCRRFITRIIVVITVLGVLMTESKSLLSAWWMGPGVWRRESK